jgi:AraC-like DNA-binding protein
VVPDPDLALAFGCYRARDGRPVDPQLLLLGPIAQPRVFSARASYEMVAVKIRVECVKPLLGVAPGDHVDGIDDAAAALPHIHAPAFGLLLRTRRAEDALAVLVNVVARLAADADFDDHRATSHLLAAIRRTRGAVPIETLVDRLGMSLRTARRHTIDCAGVSPKRYARGVRFLAALTRADLDVRSSRMSWSRIAAEYGFADQSHLVREFAAFSGLSPGDVLLERASEVLVPASEPLVLVAEISNPAV